MEELWQLCVIDIEKGEISYYFPNGWYEGKFKNIIKDCPTLIKSDFNEHQITELSLTASLLADGWEPINKIVGNITLRKKWQEQ